MTPERLTCILIPGFSLELFYRKDPSLASKPLALAAITGGTVPVITVINPCAAGAGVTTRITVPQGHVVCPDLIVKPRDPAAETQASREILEVMKTIGPFVEQSIPAGDNPDGAVVYFLETAGLIKLYKSETNLAAEIAARIKALAYPFKTGLAANKFIARVAAEVAPVGAFMTVASGDETNFIENLDIDRLDLHPDTCRRLRDLGLKTVGNLAIFPANEMTERFGSDGAALSQLSRGHDPSVFRRRHADELLSNTVFLTYRLYRAETVVRHLERLLAPLLALLAQSGEGCRRIDVELLMEDKRRETFTAAIGQPTVSVAKFSRQLRHELEKVKLNSGVVELTVTIPERTVLASDQLVFDRKQGPVTGGPSQSEGLLQGLCNVSFNRALLPEQNFRLSPATDKRDKYDTANGLITSYCLHSTAGLRLLQPPRVTEVVTDKGRLLSIATDRARREPVAFQSGPWELSGGWWHHDFDRLYYELQTLDERRYLFFFDRLRSQWFLQGIFD